MKAIRLKELRESIGINQVDMASVMGISQAFLSLIEAGKRSITTEMVDKICNAYSFSPDMIVGEKYLEDQVLYFFNKMSHKSKYIILDLMQELC